MLALPSLTQAPSPTADLDTAVPQLRLAYLTRTPKVQSAILGVVSSFADYASPPA